jgi:hypothetical protein
VRRDQTARTTTTRVGSKARAPYSVMVLLSWLLSGAQGDE